MFFPIISQICGESLTRTHRKASNEDSVEVFIWVIVDFSLHYFHDFIYLVEYILLIEEYVVVIKTS